jgi:hypothetical protein
MLAIILEWHGNWELATAQTLRQDLTACHKLFERMCGFALPLSSPVASCQLPIAMPSANIFRLTRRKWKIWSDWNNHEYIIELAYRLR